MNNLNQVRGYKIDHVNESLIMNYKFAAAAQIFGTPEYKLVKEIHNDFPNIKDIVKSGREKKTAHKFKRLTYKNMEEHIKSYSNSDEILHRFELAKQLSTPLASPYKYVRDWFTDQFPNYQKITILSDNKIKPTVELKSLPDIQKYSKKEGA